MRNTIYSERHRCLHSFLRNVIKNKFVNPWISKYQNINPIAIDPLTGIYNQFGINSYLKELHPQVGVDYAIILLNVDNFKKIQQEFGLQHADTALISITTILSNHLRDTDLIGRYGEHEFIIILSNTNLEKAKHVTQRLANLIQSKAIKIQTRSVLLQASCGISISAPETLSNQVLEQADQALLIAKSHGFNQIRDRNAVL
ncbi:diguanylate cyclase domain-containing protein [Acinetobacter sp. ANC 4648]|uniref:diguanylate cyclase domain-containing protein n=1 Tax=Acinetobacter sp. ANC 4648 TaxID=1977875 RepID=UPI000A32DBD0|nr:diguanylate cyclase [Acinetobacter sp. ANC 4648]OTG85033.1 hypothetical protein B9T27_02115 [Acinetobacter sp. ANC 4648]